MNEKQQTVFKNPPIAACCALVKGIKNIAVVGLSPNALRPGYGVSASMQGFRFRVIPARLIAQEILGEKVYRTLTTVSEKIDLVNEFRNSVFAVIIVTAVVKCI